MPRPINRPQVRPDSIPANDLDFDFHKFMSIRWEQWETQQETIEGHERFNRQLAFMLRDAQDRNVSLVDIERITGMARSQFYLIMNRTPA